MERIGDENGVYSCQGNTIGTGCFQDPLASIVHQGHKEDEEVGSTTKDAGDKCGEGRAKTHCSRHDLLRPFQRTRQGP